MNIWDILILLAVAAAVAGAIRVLRKSGRRGGCSCGCGGCPGCGKEARNGKDCGHRGKTERRP